MVCVYCGYTTRVTNSRPQKRLHQVWRRRNCTKCGTVFTTIEAMDFNTSLVVKDANGHIRPFSRDKLFLSFCRAVGHRQNSIEDAGALTATVITQLLDRSESAAVSPSRIISIALQVLQRFDNAAAVQYGAYHKA